MGLPVIHDDLPGYSSLAMDAVVRTTDLVEAMHATIARHDWPWRQSRVERTRGITGFVYQCVRGVTQTVGTSIEIGLSGVLPLLDEIAPPASSSVSRDIWLAVINGILGDHLEAAGNPLAQPMEFRAGQRALTLQPDTLRKALPDAGGKLVVFIHGLCMSDVQWRRNGYSHADQLVAGQGCTALNLRYNSGRHIWANGRELAGQLNRLVKAWPVPVTELTLIGHSMGGLLARSALYYAGEAGFAWPSLLYNLVFVGTPHHGAPLERYGNRLQSLVGVTPYTAPLARLGMIRSAGVTDLRHGNLVDQDWHSEDRFASHEDHRQHLPLPEGVRCFALAATLGSQRGDWRDHWLGDGLVPVASALGRHHDPARRLEIPEDSQKLLLSTGHLELLTHPEAGAQIARWLLQH